MRPLIFTTENLLLRLPVKQDAEKLVDFKRCNQTHWQKWESAQEEDEQKQLEGWIIECKEGRSAQFFCFLKDQPDQIIGVCNFTQIFRGSFQACYLGYKIHYAYEGKGFMYEALTCLIKYVFEKLNLHRIMANYTPSNKKSEKLLKRLGFEIEGYAKSIYLLMSDEKIMY